MIRRHDHAYRAVMGALTVNRLRRGWAQHAQLLFTVNSWCEQLISMYGRCSAQNALFQSIVVECGKLIANTISCSPRDTLWFCLKRTACGGRLWYRTTAALEPSEARNNKNLSIVRHLPQFLSRSLPPMCVKSDWSNVE